VFGQVGSSTGGEVTVTTLAGLTSDSWVSFTGFLRILPGDFVVSSGMYPGAGVVCRLTDQLGTTAYATTQAAIPDSDTGGSTMFPLSLSGFYSEGADAVVRCQFNGPATAGASWFAGGQVAGLFIN